MLDLNNQFRITKLISCINSNGTITTYNQNGVLINILSGDLTIIHKVLPLIININRREFIEEHYQDTLLPDIEFQFRIINNDGTVKYESKVPYEQFNEFSKHINK